MKPAQQLQLEQISRELGAFMKQVCPPGVGFTLFIFDHGPAGFMSYVSNANRQDMLKCLEEFKAKLTAGEIDDHTKPGRG